jgi:hypothetical protein
LLSVRIWPSDDPVLAGSDAAGCGSDPVEGLDLIVLEVARKRVTLMRGNKR